MCRSFAMVGGDVRRMLVVVWPFFGCCADFRMSQESMLSSVVWPRMYHLCFSESHGAAVVSACIPMRISRMESLVSVSVSL